MSQNPEIQPAPPAYDAANPKAAAKAAKAYAKALRPWFKKKRWWVVGAVVLIAIAGAAGGGGSTTDKPSAGSTPTVSAAPADAVEDAAEIEEKPTPEPAKPAEPKLTAAQENALGAAENYLSFAPFSKQGLIRQLSSDAGDGYALKDARYAADHVGADWNEQAAKAAKNYLDMMSFSRSGLIEQLESSAGDQYTHAQAVYGVTKAGL